MGNDEKEGLRPGVGLSRLFAVLALFGILALPPLVSMVAWWLQPEVSIRALILDKTVPHENYREHDSIIWMLNHVKSKSPRGDRPWLAEKDYLGYDPVTWVPPVVASDLQRVTLPVREGSCDPDHAWRYCHLGRVCGGAPPVCRDDQVCDNRVEWQRPGLDDDVLRNIDVVFLADTYGVYVLDEPGVDTENTALDYSPMLYGGVTVPEAEAVERHVARGGALIGEFNTIGSPTPYEARQRLENLFGVTWTEWSGRCFLDLDDETEVPEWARRHYRCHYHEEWRFTGPGCLLSNEDTRIVVLERGRDIGPLGLRIGLFAKDDELLDGVLEDVPFRYWFDVNKPQADTDVLAWYLFDLTPEGKMTMDTFGLPQVFPAMLRRSREPLRLYLAGDVSDNGVDKGPYYFRWWHHLHKIGRLLEHQENARGYFWEFYVPLMQNVLHHLGVKRGQG
jgi:hypothetical protein